MSDSTMEIDFFQQEKQTGSPRPPSERAGSSCRRIQNVVSKINPVLLKTVMAGEAAAQARCANNMSFWTNKRPLQSSCNPPSPSPTPDSSRALLSPLPVLNPSSRCSMCSTQHEGSVVHGNPETAPLTIFYNGTVTAFDVTSDEAEAIMRMAESGTVEKPGERPEEPVLEEYQEEGDLPIARRKSLQTFLEKRKGRYRAPAEPFTPLSSMHGSPSKRDLQGNRGRSIWSSY